MMHRTAMGLLWAHAGLVLFSTAAMVTILAGAFPVWMQGPYTQTVFDLGWRYSGQVYILLGAGAALAHAVPRIGAARATGLFAVATLVALASELGGTNVGLPFGPYHYTPMLGYRIAGDVPYAIPISWFYMLYASLALSAAFVSDTGDGGRARWRLALVAGAVLTAWDVAMEVQMTNVQPAHWVWDLAKVPEWMPDWLTGPLFHGMPLSNWVGWYLTGVVVSRLMLALVPPGQWRTAVGAGGLPWLLYAVNMVMPVAVTARHGFWDAAVLGAAAMGVPLLLAHRAARASGALGRSLTPP